MFRLGRGWQKDKKKWKKYSLPYCVSSHNTWNKLQREVCYKVAGTHPIDVEKDVHRVIYLIFSKVIVTNLFPAVNSQMSACQCPDLT